MKEPVDHIERPPLPWRAGEQSLTECGLAATSTRTITRTDYNRRLKEWGQQRTAMTVCMTCLTTAQNYLDWDGDPRQAIDREINWEGCGRWDRGHGTRMRDELRAIAILIERHKDEFLTLVHDVQGTVSLFDPKRKRKGRA